MESALNEQHLVAHFDRLVEEGMVVLEGGYRTVNVEDRGLLFEFRILPNMAKKPRAPRDGKAQSSSEQQPGCRPGSDISASGYEIAALGLTHVLAANKFPAARPHFLILTQDGFRRQYEALDVDDMTAARRVLSSLQQRRYLLLFNCGLDSGCSRMHKHLQILPAPDPERFPLWPDSEELRLPFRAFTHRFQDGLPPADALLAIYQGLLRRAESAVGRAPPDGEPAVPHNVVLSRDWLVVIPRRAAGWHGAVTNAAGMLGMVWVQSAEKVQIWQDLGPAAVLAQLGVPADAE